jgi:hypothetical protein
MERCGAGELRGTVERRETRLNRDRVDSAANPDHGHAQSGSLKSIPEALEFCTPRATCFRTARLAPLRGIGSLPSCAAIFDGDPDPLRRKWLYRIDDEHADGWKPCREKRRIRAEGGIKREEVVSVTCLQHIERLELVDIPAEYGSPHPHRPVCIRSHAPLKSGLRFSLNARMPSR